MEEYKLQVIELFKLFRRQYGSLTKNLTDLDSAETLFMWIKDLHHAGVPPEKVSIVGDSIRRDERYVTYPPNIMQFIEHYRAMESANEGDLPEQSPFNALIDRLVLRYSANLLFRSSPKEYWISELQEHIEQPIDPLECERMIREDMRFNKFPPNVDELILIISMQCSGRSFYPVGSAYDEAVSNKSNDIDPLVREARRRFGGIELKTRYADVARDRFTSLYEQVIRDYISGKFSLENATQQSCADTGEPDKEDAEQNRVNLINVINDLLA